MDLAAWLKLQPRGRSETWLAGRIDCNQKTVNRWKRRVAECPLEKAMLIEVVTEGEVPAEDLPLSDSSRAALKAFRASQASLAAAGAAAALTPVEEPEAAPGGEGGEARAAS